MATAVAIAFLCLSHIGAFAFPAPQTDSPTGSSSKFQWQIYKSCDDGNRSAITNAWRDSVKFADALNSWKPKERYQPAMEMYMGDRCTFDEGEYNFTRQIQDTARRTRGLYDGVSEYGTANLWVYCNEDSRWFRRYCAQSDKEAVLAYEEEDIYFNNWYITFCPAFYNESWAAPLDTIVQDATTGETDPMLMESWYYSQAGTFFHELMHMSQLVTSPQAVDKAYGPKNVYELARSRNTDAAVYNADSWNIVAQAIFAQQILNLQTPPYPKDYPPAGVTPGTGQGKPGRPLKTVIEAVKGFVPEGAVAKPNEPFFVDPDIWDVQLPIPAEQPTSVPRSNP